MWEKYQTVSWIKMRLKPTKARQGEHYDWLETYGIRTRQWRHRSHPCHRTTEQMWCSYCFCTAADHSDSFLEPLMAGPLLNNYLNVNISSFKHFETYGIGTRQWRHRNHLCHRTTEQSWRSYCFCTAADPSNSFLEPVVVNHLALSNNYLNLNIWMN